MAKNIIIPGQLKNFINSMFILLFLTVDILVAKQFLSSPTFKLYLLVSSIIKIFFIIYNARNFLSSYFSKKTLGNFSSFFIPKTPAKKSYEATFYDKNVSVVIPTYKPSLDTYNLIKSISDWFPKVSIVVVDDSSPLDPQTQNIFTMISELARSNYKIIILRTAENQMKAGALNYGVNYLRSLVYQRPDVVFTFDDDVKIVQSTIPEMINELYKHPRIGIVCSQVRVINKNKNLLTRMQAMEYHSFNITKIADNGFFRGPLVMQGMLAAIRMNVLEDLNGFSKGHLIEDYDFTVRSKIKGWEVRISQTAVAWTKVPETFSSLWKQRARWTSGGLRVIIQNWSWFTAIYQDLVGHFTFIILLVLITLSFIYAGTYQETAFTPVLFAISSINFGVILIYTVLTHLSYPDRDFKDSILKFTFFPEFIYSNLLSLILLGSYLFLFYSFTASKFVAGINNLYKLSQSGFSRIGYSATWGTR